MLLGCEIKHTSTSDKQNHVFLSDFHCLQEEVKKTCSPFQLTKITSCGSDANLYAVCMISGGMSTNCLFACGSYIAGDGGPLQKFSTSQFDVQQRVAIIQEPMNAMSDAQMFTVPLPYHIPCSTCTSSHSDLVNLEEECLKELHMCCLLAAINGDPIKGLVMELVLAGNGGTLSHCFLIKLAALSVEHGFGIIVDKIMMAGHMKLMLLTLQKPKEFQQCIFAVTLGKWPRMGFILENQDTMISIQKEDLSSRGASTGLATCRTLAIWKDVVKLLPNVDQCCAQVLDKLRVKSGEDWGEGTLIFCSKKGVTLLQD